MIKYINSIFLGFVLLLPVVAMSQEAGDSNGTDTSSGSSTAGTAQSSTPSSSDTSKQQPSSDKKKTTTSEKPAASESSKEDSASSAASQALKASKEEEEKQKSQETAQEVVEKGGLIAGKFQVAVTESYSHSQTNQLYISGFGILPVVVVGNVDVQSVRRDTFTTILNASYKLTPKLQVSMNVPWQYNMSSISKATGIKGRSTASANDQKNYQSSSLGDISFGLYYQMTQQTLHLPSLAGSLSLKLRNGRDFFETPDPAAHAPAGSGFYALSGSLSVSKTSAPAVLYGSFGYSYNFERNNIIYTPANSSAVVIKNYKPGAGVNISAGVSLSVNYQLSLSWTLAESTQFSSQVNGRVSPNSATNSINFTMGASYRLSEKTTVSLSLSTGLSSDAGGSTISLRVPWSY